MLTKEEGIEKFVTTEVPVDSIIHGNTLDVLRDMPSESIDCCITSPPYWGLRDYGVDGALGLEPTFNEYLDKLLAIFDEVKRILKKSGTCWVNLGDTYSNSKTESFSGTGAVWLTGHWKDNAEVVKRKDAPENWIKTDKLQTCGSVKTKSLCGIPFRFATQMIDSGWILRNSIIWHKPSCMPSSAKDRFTVDHENVFFFTKNKKYYFEQQFEAQTEKPSIGVDYRKRGALDKPHKWDNESVKTAALTRGLNHTRHNPNGRNRRTVWRINPQPFKGAHFAVFPEKLVEPMIKAGCHSEICDSCGMAFSNEYQNKLTNRTAKAGEGNGVLAAGKRFGDACDVTTSIKKCDCNAPTHAGIVLDPFSGSGTTAVVARKLGRHYIGIDLNADYCTMAEKRLEGIL